MSVVAFDNALWIARYPEFSAVGATLGALYFAEAGLYCDNTDLSPVTDLSTRALYLYMLTSHAAWLAGSGTGNPGAKLVGRIANGTQGSTSVQVELDPGPKGRAFFVQTPYGFAFWQASVVMRSSVYVTPTQAAQRPGGLPWDFTG